MDEVQEMGGRRSEEHTSELQSPDLAITEAAVGAGVTSILFFITLKKIRAISKVHDEADGRTICGEGRDEQEKG